MTLLKEYVAQGRVKLDEADLLKYGNWTAVITEDAPGYFKVRVREDRMYATQQKLGRVLLNVSDPNLEVDHEDRNPLNYSRSNLRIATKQQNRQNKGLPRNNKSGYKGVIWAADRQQWRAYISVDGCIIQLGGFDDPIAAAKVRDTAARKYHGEFAFQNFPADK